jgi:hypothetical protein
MQEQVTSSVELLRKSTESGLKLELNVGPKTVRYMQLKLLLMLHIFWEMAFESSEIGMQVTSSHILGAYTLPLWPAGHFKFAPRTTMVGMKVQGVRVTTKRVIGIQELRWTHLSALWQGPISIIYTGLPENIVRGIYRK